MRVRVEDSELGEPRTRSQRSCGPKQSVTLLTLWSYRVLDCLRDGSPGEIRGIPNRLIFESGIDARDRRNSREVTA